MDPTIECLIQAGHPCIENILFTTRNWAASASDTIQCAALPIKSVFAYCINRWQTQSHILSLMFLNFLRLNLSLFTKQMQLSREAFGHQNAATPSGGSTSLGWCPNMLERRLPSMILAVDPCPVMFIDRTSGVD